MNHLQNNKSFSRDYKYKTKQDGKDKGKEGQWLPSYIRAKRRGSSTKLCRLAFRGSGYEGILPTEVIIMLKM